MRDSQVLTAAHPRSAGVDEKYGLCYVSSGKDGETSDVGGSTHSKQSNQGDWWVVQRATPVQNRIVIQQETPVIPAKKGIPDAPDLDSL